jgi:putative ATP-binding cassette transporter
VALLALIHAELGRAGPPDGTLAWAFAGLCLVGATTRVVSQAAMVRLGHGAVAALCLQLCRKILALPLARFEEADRAGLLTVLTQDIVIVAGALVGLPLICINLPVVVACLAYVGWLSARS